MTRTVLLSGAALAAFWMAQPARAMPPVHRPATVLWNQNSNFGGNVNSQNFTSGTGAYSDAAADDFVVPAGQIWHVSYVDVTGLYFDGSGPASSVGVAFYADRKGRPGRLLRGPYTLQCFDNGGSFECPLPKPARLRAGTWWMSLVATVAFGGGEWNWIENTTVHGHEAVWEDPGGGGTCTTWKPLHVCFGGAPADLAFELKGRSSQAD